MELIKPVVELYRRMSYELPEDVTAALTAACAREEKGSPAREAIETIVENVRLAREKGRPLCQDTGTPVFYVMRPAAAGEAEIREAALRPLREVGPRRRVRSPASRKTTSEADIRKAILRATREATERGILRPNAVDPVIDLNSADNTGEDFPIIHISERGGAMESGSPDPHPGPLPDRERGELVIDAMLKGGGSENVGARYKLPEARLGAARDLEGVRRCVLDAVWRAQGRGCPPYVLGVAIGGARDATAALAKKQLLRRLDDTSPNAALAELEAQLLKQTNRLGIGPAGLGGKTTAIGVKVASQHRHCACYFVEVAFGCWAMRRGRLLLDGGRPRYA